MISQRDGTQIHIGWDELEGIIRGVSAIDMQQMSVRTLEEAERFIGNYGYNFQNPRDWAEIISLQQDAVRFIEEKLLNADMPWEELGEAPLTLEIPQAYKEESDIRHLLLQASSGHGVEQLWACAILKVMHILCHIQNAMLFHCFDEAKSQIVTRYHKILSHNDAGGLVLGNPEDLTLHIAGFEVKDEKSKDSIVLKLLCKRETVAEEVFDMIGVRIITHTPAESVIALEILHRNNIVIFPNIIPSRSRNSLIDFDEFKAHYQRVFKDSMDHEHEQSVNHILNTVSSVFSKTKGKFNPKNTSSLESYRSIHITERQLIRLAAPGKNNESRFFFPYEIQVVDEVHYVENMSGSSSHSKYKQNQLIQARRRVLGPLLILERREKAGRKKPLLK